MALTSIFGGRKPAPAALAALDELARDPGWITLERTPEGYDALVIAEIARRRGGRTLLLARDDRRAEALGAALSFFAPDLELVSAPAWDCQPYDRASPSAGVAAARAESLRRLAHPDAGAPVIIVATVGAALQRAAPRASMKRAGFRARAGAVIEREAITRYLSANGYARVATVMEPGDYAIRGGVVDVFPPKADTPLRLDFFGDELLSVRSFDPHSQRTTKQLSEADFAPVSEILLDPEAITRFRKGFVAAFGGIAQGGDAVYEAVSAGRRAQGAEHWLPLFHDRLETLFDYAGDAALVVLDQLAEAAASERLKLIADYHAARAEAPAAKAGPEAPAYRVLPADALYLSEREWREALASSSVRAFTAFAVEDAKAAGRVVDLGARPGRDFAPERQTEGSNVFNAAADHVRAKIGEGKRVVLAGWTEGSSERTGGVFSDHGVEPIVYAPSWPDAQNLPKDVVARVLLPLEHGFETDSVVVVAEPDLLGDRLARPRGRRKAANFIMETSALGAGDLVVHVDHGIGRYLGLRTLEVQGSPHDCLELEYAGSSKLFLPVENIELLSRYGSEDTGVALDRLGGAAWQARKAKAKQRLLEMAGELIRIAAARAVRSTEPLAAPSGVYDEFCARFPYAETDDQQHAIDDALADLAAGRPMDRLVCGDVGFGKTEVALRAAFVAAMNGVQVAVVCPTTLLARQHHKNFVERFKGWPVKIGRLSRLVPTKEASDTRAALADGRLDLVVGTHAVLSKQVSFKSLGLMIVDEEHHFGVKHKERLKDLRADVHVLTLTATPIPRTLQMSLSGLRDLSIIATPPVDRLAVRTYVAPFDPVSLREALLRERYRGGQSFVVVPRLSDLPEIEDFLQRRVSEVSYVLAHGQMSPTDLEERITAFYEGRYDVLLSTPIVESGLDIPTANTLIVHRADRFGLAQLHQLRGRVGRSKTRAYAYLTIPADWKIAASAEKRLKVLQSLDTLGAGFQLASHDLDMRGGGNLLGEEQSGHIKDVGVELFQSMLEEAVATLKDAPDAKGSSDWSPSINVGAAVLIPEDYVSDLDVRLSLYRRLSSLHTAEDREAFAAELIDRFGALPEAVAHLLDVLEIKSLCRRIGAQKADAGPKGAVVAFKPEIAPDPAQIVAYVARSAGRLKLRPDGTLFIAADWPEAGQRVKGLRKALVQLDQALKPEPATA